MHQSLGSIGAGRISIEQPNQFASAWSNQAGRIAIFPVYCILEFKKKVEIMHKNCFKTGNKPFDRWPRSFTLTMLALLLPLIGNRHTLALLISGYVMVIRSGGGFGESAIGAINRLVSFSNGWPGNSEQVCPSGPMPNSNRSNCGITP